MQGGYGCSLCGRPVDPARATLSTSTGLPICPMCVGAEGLAATQGRAAASLAYGSLSAALSAWVLQFLICGILGLGIAVASIVTGAQALNLLSKPDYRNAPNRGVMQAAAIGGIVLASLLVLFYVLSITLFAAMGLLKR
jgi:hypothetical protein